MNVSISGVADQILEQMIKLGFAKTKSEAIRYAILRFGEEMGLIDEQMLVKRKLDRIDREIKEGRRRVLSYEEALK